MFEFRLPDLGEGIHEGELLQWHVVEGGAVKEDDPLCDMETDKAAVTIPSPRTGVVASLKGRPGDTITVGEVFVVINDAISSVSDDNGLGKKNIGDSQDSGGQAAPDFFPPREPAAENRVIAAPATRRLAREMGIDIKIVTGTGPGGRVTSEDLTAPGAGSRAASLTDAPSRASVDFGQNGEMIPKFAIPFLEISSLPQPDGPVERIPIQSLRKKTAVKTTSSSILVPHVAHMDDIDVTEIEELRKKYNQGHPDKGRLTLMAFVVKALVAGLREYPMFNASVDIDAGEIVHKKFYNIGFAADTPRGLVVPVIHDADRHSLSGIGWRIRHLAERARQGNIEVAELTQGTFTVTNVGSIGGTHVLPIINTPETAILGLGRVEKKPVVRDDEIVIRKILPVTLCFDHRVADGARAAAFVREIKQMLEDSLEFMGRI